MILAFESVDSVDCPPQCECDITQSVAGLYRTKKVEEREIHPLLLSACLRELGYQSSAFGMGFISLASLHPRPSDSNWNYTTGFPRSPACRWHIMELPKVHYYMSQFLIIVRTPQDLFVHIIY